MVHDSGLGFREKIWGPICRKKRSVVVRQARSVTLNVFETFSRVQKSIEPAQRQSKIAELLLRWPFKCMLLRYAEVAQP